MDEHERREGTWLAQQWDRLQDKMDALQAELGGWTQWRNQIVTRQERLDEKLTTIDKELAKTLATLEGKLNTQQVRIGWTNTLLTVVGLLVTGVLAILWLGLGKK